MDMKKEEIIEKYMSDNLDSSFLRRHVRKGDPEAYAAWEYLNKNDYLIEDADEGKEMKAIIRKVKHDNVKSNWFDVKFTRLPTEAVTDPRLLPIDIRVFLYIVSRCDNRSENTIISVDTICDNVYISHDKKISNRWASESLKRLQQVGLIEREYRGYNMSMRTTVSPSEYLIMLEHEENKGL